MCSENVTSLPYFSVRSGFIGFSLPETTEAHLETPRLLPAWTLSHCAGLPPGFCTLPVDQAIERLHGQGGAWKLPGSFSGFQPLADHNFEDGILLSGCDKLRQTTSSADGFPFPPSKKFANDLSYRRNRPPRDLINTLPDEMLCNIFQFLASARDRVACASVSKRWLMLQSHMSREGFPEEDESNPGKIAQIGSGCLELDDEDSEDDQAEFMQRKEHWGDLSRCLTGRKASDVRLAAIALGTGSRGGLGKLCIRGGPAAGLQVSVTDVGLSAIGSWCSGLRVLSLWSCPLVTDEGLSAIGKGCRLLERVDLFKCPLLEDAGLMSIAKNCALLSFLNLDECERVGDNGLIAVSEHCPDVMTLTIQNCPRISDCGIMAAVSSLKRLKKMKLAGLRISDNSLASIGAQATALLWLTLQNLDLVSVYGFAFLSMAGGLQSLKRLSVSSCRNFTDVSLALLGKNCLSLKHISLFKCEQVTDEGLTLFMNCASLLQVVELEKCHAITGTGLVAALSGMGSNLKEVQVKKCEGIRNIQGFVLPRSPNGSAIESLCLAECPGVGDLVLALIGILCSNVTKLDLSGLTDITDDGVLSFLCGRRKLTSVKISGCVNVTDRAICAIAHECGQSLRTLVLDGCKNVSDRSLKAIASQSSFVEDLDVSGCAIGYEGLKLLVDATGETLSSLNLSGCIGVTDRILPLIHKNCNALLDLNMKNCIGISERAIAGFQGRMWNCTVLY